MDNVLTSLASRGRQINLQKCQSASLSLTNLFFMFAKVPTNSKQFYIKITARGHFWAGIICLENLKKE